MRRARLTGESAVYRTVNDLARKFEYPDENTLPIPGGGGGGGGMAHILIVSDSEPSDVQAKADYVVSSSASAGELQGIFDSISGTWSIWMAGVFTLDDDVITPSGCLIRGLGYTSGAV